MNSLNYLFILYRMKIALGTAKVWTWNGL